MQKPHKWKAGQKLAHKRSRHEKYNFVRAMLAVIHILEAELGMR